MITLIAAIGRNNELGFKNKLLWNIPDDMAHFKSYTMGKVVIMGRKTFASIGKELPGRRNVIISSYNCGSIGIAAHSIDAALSIENCYDELVVIGGASIYEQTIDRADKLVITHIDAEFEADAFFPLVNLTEWSANVKVDKIDVQYSYKIIEYTRIM